MSNLPEVWLRGPLEKIPSLLQPIAHALSQVGEELDILLENFSDDNLWIKPLGMASVGFHLQHMSGVSSRLLSYAKDESLSVSQLEYLKQEGVAVNSITTKELLAAFHVSVQQVNNYLSGLQEADLAASRTVGRAKLQSTLMGLLVHIAEHTMRHLGQLLVTVKIISSGI